MTQLYSDSNRLVVDRNYGTWIDPKDGQEYPNTDFGGITFSLDGVAENLDQMVDVDKIEASHAEPQ